MKQVLLLLLVFFSLTSCASRQYRSQNQVRYPSIPISRAPKQTPPFLTYTPPAKPVSPVINKGLIVVDAGHGGKDFGTNSPSNPKYLEKNLTLSTAFMLKTYLQQMGYEVVLTRDDDTFIALDERAQMANNQKPKAFISVHYNHAESKEAQGVEVYYYKSEENKNRTSSSKQLAESILSNVIHNTQAKSRGVKHGNFAVIRETKMPAILIEGGFLSNESEMEKIKKAGYLKQLAWGIANGLDEYIDRRKT